MTFNAALLWLCLAEALFIVVLWSRRATRKQVQQAPVERLKSERLLSDLATHDLDERITEPQQAKDALSEIEERFRLVANTAPVMIWMSDTTKLCTYFNKQWLDFVGRPMSAELGNGWVDGVHADDVPGCMDTYSQAFDRREPFTMQYRLRRHDGEYRWLLDNGVPRFDQSGGFAGYIGSCVDLTDSKKTEAALASFSRRLLDAQERERSRIARELHDDINQRLALLAIELQSLNIGSPSEVRARAEELFQRTVKISNDVQALSHRLHSSKLEYLGIAAAMRGFCAEFAEQQQMTVDFESSGLPTHLPRDLSLCLFRVLQEALHNAAKYSGGRHVEARLQGTSAVVRLTIRDRGRGFDTQAAVNGRGLGLISMRERVSLVNGTILITSAPGWGTEISVLVPVRAGIESELQTASSDRAG